MSTRAYIPFRDFSAEDVVFSLGQERNGKVQIAAHYKNGAEVCVLTPACVTNWPRVNGDGNFGTMWGPTDPMKTKFTVDLTDAPINESANANFNDYATVMAAIDERLLDFVQQNQLKILGRKNLSREECRMLQVPTIRPKYDKLTGALLSHAMQLNTPKYVYDGMGGKYARSINVVDHTARVIPHGVVSPGDVVALTAHVNCVYTGVGGDKFGISWAFDSVQVVCQRSRLAQPTEVSVFREQVYDFASEYMTDSSTFGPTDVPVATDQFNSEPMTVCG